jgi:TonB-linked SusC/RagA family outer membrane protein
MTLKRLLVQLFVISAFTVPVTLFAQEIKVIGKIIDSKTNQPLNRATVKVKNTETVTTSDENGTFAIKAPSSESIISVTYTGYEVYEIKAGTGDLTIKLNNLSGDLNEVIVIGYGTQRQKTVTGSVVNVNMGKIYDQPVATITEALRGMVPGLAVQGGSQRPGALPNISIRQQFNWGKDGGNTIPLIIIDDVIQLDPQTGLSTMDRFNLLDPTEVESITVLRDASAAIYGYRASQGAIVVKTKRGKAGPPRINYSGKFETMDAVSHGKVMNAYEYGVFANRFGRAAGNWNKDNHFFSDAELERMKSLNYDWLMGDWEKSGAMQHSLDVSGGSERATYFVGGSYYTQGANLGMQDYKKYTFRAGTDVAVASGLKFGATIAANNSDLEKSFTKIALSDGSYGLGGEQNDYSVLLHMPKYIPWIYNIGGVDRFVSPAMGPHKLGNVSGNGALSNQNYYAWQNNGSKQTNKTFGYNANFSLQYDIPFIKGLSAKVNYAIQSTSSNTEQVLMPITLSRNGQAHTANHHLYDSAVWDNPVLNRSQSRVGYYNQTGTTTQMNFFVNYDRSFGDHNFSAVFSGERIENNWEDRQQLYENPIPGAYNGTSVSAGTLTTNTITYKTENGSLSYLGRFSYNYKSKYLFQFLFRSDASNVFAPENYWGVFPSVSAGWVISDENFFRDNVPFVNFLKIRASVGKTGNNNVKPWKWMQLYKAELDKGMGFGNNGGALTTGITPEVAPNRDIRWDNNLQRNFGIDFSMLQNRLSVSVDQYFNTYTNVLTVMSGAIGVPISVGGGYAEENYAGIKSWGTEISATWKDKIANKVDYSIGMNFGIGDNKTTKYFDQPFDYLSKLTTRRAVGNSGFPGVWGFRTWKETSGGDGILRTDEDIDAYWAYLTDLANKSGIAGAAPKYLDVINKSGMKKGMLAYEDAGGALNSTDETYAGQNGIIEREQDYVLLKKNSKTYGINTNLSFSYAGITLMAQIVTSWGGLNRLDYIKQGTSSSHGMWAHPVYLNDMYDSTDNPGGKYPNLALFDDFGGVNSDFFTLSSFRMYVRSLSVGYALPRNLVRRARFENARVYLTGNNLWDFYNPYPNKYRNMYDAPNVGYPTMRTWAVGINLGF